MKRCLLNLLTALSLLLLTIVTALWVRSHFVREEFAWVRTNLAGLGAVRFPLFEHIYTMTWARGGVRLDAAMLDFSGPAFFSTGEWTPPGLTRRSSLIIGRYPTVRPEWQKTPPALRPAVSWGGLEFAASQMTSPDGWTDGRCSLTLPFWSLALFTGALPLWRIVLRRRSRRAGFPVQPSERKVSADA